MVYRTPHLDLVTPAYDHEDLDLIDTLMNTAIYQLDMITQA